MGQLKPDRCVGITDVSFDRYGPADWTASCMRFTQALAKNDAEILGILTVLREQVMSDALQQYESAGEDDAED